MEIPPIPIESTNIPDLIEPSESGGKIWSVVLARRSSNPEIQTLLKKITKARKRNAEQSEIEALKAQLALLERKAGEVPLSSVVDHPSFHLKKNRSLFALVIGVEHYPGDIPHALFAKRDADAVKRHLQALGVPTDHIRTLIDGIATKSRIQGAIHWLSRNAGSGDTVWVYFSGHGSPSSLGVAYLVPYDGDPSDLVDTGYRLTDFYHELDDLKAKRVIVALDACFTGGGSRSILGSVRPLVIRIRPGTFPENGRIVSFSAARANQEAGVLKAKGHGLFTYYLLRGLDGKAMRGNHVTVSSLFDYLSPRVRKKASLANRNQDPDLEPMPIGTLSGVRLR